MSFVSHSSKLANLRRIPHILPFGKKYRWQLEADWYLKWGRSCGTEPLIFGVCANSG